MDISIHTAQNINIAYKPAGLLNRIAATLIDLSFLGGICLICLGIWGAIPALKDITFIPVVVVAVLLTYHLLFEYFLNGKSLGKLVLHLRVVRLDGKRLSFWDCMLRWVLRLVDISASMGLLAMLSIIISSKMQRLGDLAAGTTVILENPRTGLEKLDIYDTPEDYQVSFPQAVMLSDKDIHIIKEILRTVDKTGEYKLLEPLALKLKSLISVETRMNNQQFIQTLLSDYNHLTKGA